MVTTFSNGQDMMSSPNEEDVQRREIVRREPNTEEKSHSATITARDNKKRKTLNSCDVC